MAFEDDLIAKLRKLKTRGETWDLGVRKGRTWVERKKGDIYRPYILLLVSEQNIILDTRLFDHSPSAAEVWQEMARAMRHPMLGAGVQRRPQKIHTDQAELADGLRPLLEQADIGIEYVEQLPILDEAFQELSTTLSRREPDKFGIWKTAGMTEPLARRLYELAAEFYRLAPWKLLREEIAVEVRYPAEADPRYAVVMGARGEEFGVSINDRLEDLSQMWTEHSPKKFIHKFSWLTLSFDTPDYLPFDDLDAAEQYGWSLPGPNTVPWIVRVGGMKDFSPASLKDLLWLEGALAALIQYFTKNFHPGTNGLPLEERRTYSVETLNGPVKAVVRAPVWPEDFLPETPVALLTPKEQEKAGIALDKAANYLRKQDWKAAVRTYLALLKWLPQDRELQEIAWSNLGNAYMMLKDFDQGYLAFSRALEYSPESAYLWGNRGMAAIFTFRGGQAQRDLEKAVRLEKDKRERRRYQEGLDKARRMVKEEMRIRKNKVSIEQLIEQQDLFNQGLRMMAEKRWQEAEKAFRRVVEIADVLPQPNGNLGMALFMQRRWDEAETALRRALEIDPEYQLARDNLALLAQTRKTGMLPREYEIKSPFEDKDLNISLVFRE
jgi:tetratricopeptide (TPR) repeat protein